MPSQKQHQFILQEGQGFTCDNAIHVNIKAIFRQKDGTRGVIIALDTPEDVLIVRNNPIHPRTLSRVQEKSVYATEGAAND